MSSAAGAIFLMLEHLYPDVRPFVNDAPGGGITMITGSTIATYKTPEEVATVTEILRNRCEREGLPEYVWKP